MGLRFSCPNCQQETVLGYVRIGEPFVCRTCHATGTVPADAVTTDAAPTIVSELPDGPLSPLAESMAERPPALPHAHGFSGYRVFSLVGIAFNVFYLLVSVVGIPVVSTQLTLSSVFFLLLYFGTAIWNIAVLSGRWLDSRKGAIAASVVFFIFLQIIVAMINDDVGMRAGAVFMIVVGIISVIALAVCTKESWLALRIERSRLEEMKRISDLRSNLNLPDEQSNSKPH